LTQPVGDVREPFTPSSAATVGLSAVSASSDASDFTDGYIATIMNA
jgi:hypothetical protein